MRSPGAAQGRVAVLGRAGRRRTGSFMWAAVEDFNKGGGQVICVDWGGVVVY
jgi:hypothetical protein